MPWFDEVKFDVEGLVPVIAQESATGELLMLAYANREALERTHHSGRAHYWSRSRQSLWEKGETSGNTQRVEEIRLDCDGDAVVYRVIQVGPACHTLHPTCFFRVIDDDRVVEDPSAAHVLSRVDNVIADRLARPREGSYTNYLFDSGIDKILKKIGEEATETVVAAKNDSSAELRAETADLLFHILVLLRARNLPLAEVWAELNERFGRSPRTRSAATERSVNS